MNATAIATSNSPLQLVNVQLTEQIQLPVALRPVPTQAELTDAARKKVLFIGLSGVAAAGGLAASAALGTVSYSLGQPLLANLGAANFADGMTLLTAGGAAAAGAAACYGTYNSVRHLIAGAKAALGLGKFDLLPEGKTHPNLEPSYAGPVVTARTLATEALAFAGTAMAGASFMLLSAPQSFYGYAAGAAALLASFVTGRSAVKNSVAWATNMLQAEVQTRIGHALQAAVESGEIPASALQEPTPEQQPAARPEASA